mgnify:CR=1 FL=1
MDENSTIQINHVNVSTHKGTIKQPVDSVTLDSRGIQGDAHAGAWHRQVSLIAQKSLEVFYQQTGRRIHPGEFAENLTIEGMDLTRVNLLDRFVKAEVILEVTQLGKKCHGDDCAIFREVGKCAMPEEGVFTRVIQGGQLFPGDKLEYRPKSYRVMVITLSDRAAAGHYPDKSGPKIGQKVERHLTGLFPHVSVERMVISDDQGRLLNALQQAKKQAYDVVFTTGSTGIGSRDIGPETTRLLMDKEIPGIMEMVRMKYGRDKPAALLSRSVAGVMDHTLVYALPGSSRAVGEYLEVILPTLHHSLMMVHDLDVH